MIDFNTINIGDHFLYNGAFHRECVLIYDDGKKVVLAFPQLMGNKTIRTDINFPHNLIKLQFSFWEVPKYHFHAMVSWKIPKVEWKLVFE